MEDYIEINYKKLRKIRKEKGLSITKVAEEINIPAATLQKYETGLIKKMPLNLLKKICDLYETKYILFFTKEINSISDIVFYFLTDLSFYRKGKEFLKILDIEEYFKANNFSSAFSCLYNKLTQEEKEEYLSFKLIAETCLKSNKYFKNNELKKEEISLFSFFYANKIKKEKNINLDILKKF